MTLNKVVETLKQPKSIFWLCVIFMLILPFNSSNIGFSSDELNQWDYGRGALKYYKTFGEDTTSYQSYQRYDKMFRKKGMIYYGSFFFVTYSYTAQLFPQFSPHDVRHFLTALVGLVCIIFTGLITKEVSGSWRAGTIAIWLMFLTPFFVGHSLVNDKDIPAAATMAMGTYYIIRLVKELPTFNYGSLIGFVIATGLAIGVRMGGLLLIPYLFLFIGMGYLMNKEFRRKYLLYNRDLLYKNIGWLVLISILGYLLGIFWYPYIMTGNIIQRTIEVFKAISDHHLNVTQVFEGEMMRSKDFPWYYQIKYMAITIPVIILLLFATFLPTYLYTAKKQIKPIYVFILLFATIFPVVYIIYTDANVYGQWRHILFVYPTFIALCALNVHYLNNHFQNKYLKYGIIGVVALSLVKPAIWMIQNHPYEYIYRNMTVGGFDDSYSDYVGESYRLATLDSYQWLKENVTNHSDKLPVNVVSNDGFIMRYLANDQEDTFSVSNSGYKALCFKDWDYAVMSTIFLRPELKETLYPPAETIYSVDVEDRPVSAVVKRPKNSKLGYQYYRQQNINKALEHFKKAYENHPDYMCNWFYLGQIYLKQGQVDRAIRFLNKYADYFPSNMQTKAGLADAHYRKGNYTEARRLYYLLLRNNVDFVQKFKLNYVIGDCFFKTKNYQRAAKFVNRSLQHNSNFQPARRLKKRLQQQGY